MVSLDLGLDCLNASGSCVLAVVELRRDGLLLTTLNSSMATISVNDGLSSTSHWWQLVIRRLRSSGAC